MYINDHNRDKPLLTIFTKKGVRNGEELTFSYYALDNDSEESNSEDDADEAQRKRDKKDVKEKKVSS